MSLVNDPMYIRVYYSWLYLPVMCIVPLVALSTINASLVLAVRRSRADRKRMNVRQCRENNVTLMLVAVVAVFIVCQVRLSVLTSLTHAPETGCRNRCHRPKFDVIFRRQFFVRKHDF